MSINHGKPMHLAMYPLFAMGHITSFLRISNKLAERGHKISFFIPPKTMLKFEPQNHYPNLITFIPITRPRVDGLPEGAETTRDAPKNSKFIMCAMDLTKDTIEVHLANLKPDFIFFDFSEWLPQLARKYGIKSICYYSGLLVRYAYILPVLMSHPTERNLIKDDYFVDPLPIFPSQNFKLQPYESRSTVRSLKVDYGNGLTLIDRIGLSMRECDALGAKTCKEMESVFCDFVEKKLGKPVLPAGPVVPDPQKTKLDDKLDNWLMGFNHGTVLYCAFGSECQLELARFQEILLGFELTGRPFLAALKPPKGYETVESALPEGFLERTKERGIVYGGWVEQQQILKHPSVGCFITHCGAGSLSESMVHKCQLVLIPHSVDQFINTKMMSTVLRVGVEVKKRDEDGDFNREDVCKAVEAVMVEESEVGKEVRANHTKWREFILQDGLEESYITSFIDSLRKLLC